MEINKKASSDPREATDERRDNKGNDPRERILNEEEQNDIRNEDGHHYDRNIEREDPAQNEVPLPDIKEEETIPKMNADPK